MADNTADYFSVPALRMAFEHTGKTQRAIAKELGVTPTTVSSLLKGKSTPSMKRLHKIVDVLGGELTDYLELPPRGSWEIKHYRLASGLTQLAMAAALAIAPSVVSAWELGKYPPGTTMIPQLAVLFDVSEAKLRDAVHRQFAKAGAGATLVLAKTLAETVLGFASSATAAMEADRGITVAARSQLQAEIKARTEETLGLLAALIPQLPEESRDGPIRLVGELSSVYDLTLRP